MFYKVNYFVLFAVLSFLAAGVQAQEDTYRVAYDMGYGDGTVLGSQDREQGRPFDFANHRSYQSADKGYDTAVHDRDVYVVAYRRGFEDGYEEGFGLSVAADSVPQSPPVATSPEPIPAPQPRQPSSDQMQLPAGTEIKIKLLDSLSTDRNEKGDRLRAEVVQDVYAGSEVAIPESSEVTGTITHMKRPGRIKGRAEMTIKFEEVELPNGTRFSVDAVVSDIEDQADEEVKDEEGTIQGAGSKGEDVKRVGTAAGIGALIGILTGGGRGAKTGAAAGSVAGLAGILITRGEDIVLYSETELVIKLKQPVTVQP